MPEQTEKPALGAPYSISRVRRVINVDEIDDIAGYAVVNKREIAVHHLDAEAYRALQELQDHPESMESLQTLYDAVERACPELPRKEIDRLSGPKIGAILAIAQQGIREVETQIPNAEGPTETTDASPDSPPA